MRAVLAPLVAFLIVRTAGSAAFLCLQVASPAASAAMGIDPRLVGLVSAMAFMGSGIGSPAASGLVGRAGALRIMQGSLVAGAVSLVIASLGHPLFYLLGAALIGLSNGPITPAGSDLLVRRTPRHLLSTVFGVGQTGVTFGTALVGVLVPAVTVRAGWQAGIWCVAGLNLLAALAAEPLRGALRDTPSPTGHRVGLAVIIDSTRMVLRHPLLRETAICSAIYGAMQWNFGSFLVTYLVDELRLPYVTAGISLSLAQISGAGGRVAWGVVADRIGDQRKVLGIIGLIMTVCGAAVALFSDAWPVLAIHAVCVVLGFTAIGYNGIYLARIAALAPVGQSAFATGGALVVFNIVAVVSPLVFSGMAAALDRYGYGFALLAVGTMLAASMFFRRPAATDAESER